MPLFRFLPLSFGIEYEDVEVFRIVRVLVFELTPLLLSSPISFGIEYEDVDVVRVLAFKLIPLLLSSLVEMVSIDSVNRSITSDEILGALDSSKVLRIIGTVCDANRPDPGFVRYDLPSIRQSLASDELRLVSSFSECSVPDVTERG